MRALTHPLQKLAQRLRHEHDELARRCEDLQRRADRDDWRESDAAWDAFRSALDSHMTHEETWLLPVYELVGPGESGDAQGLRREHESLRREVERLGAERQARAVRSRDVGALLDRLRDHGRREDRSLYSWLDHQETAGHPPHGAHRRPPPPWIDRGRARRS